MNKTKIKNNIKKASGLRKINNRKIIQNISQKIPQRGQD